MQLRQDLSAAKQSPCGGYVGQGQVAASAQPQRAAFKKEDAVPVKAAFQGFARCRGFCDLVDNHDGCFKRVKLRKEPLVVKQVPIDCADAQRDIRSLIRHSPKIGDAIHGCMPTFGA